MKTSHDYRVMCVTEYYEQLSKWYSWENLVMALYMPVLAYDYIARGDY